MKPIILLLLLTGVLLFTASRRTQDQRASRALSAASVAAMLTGLGIAIFDLMQG